MSDCGELAGGAPSFDDTTAGAGAGGVAGVMLTRLFPTQLGGIGASAGQTAALSWFDSPMRLYAQGEGGGIGDLGGTSMGSAPGGKGGTAGSSLAAID